MKSLGILFGLIFPLVMSAQDSLNQVDNKGLKQGYWIKKSEDGGKVYEGRFVNDQPVDTFLYYDVNGDKNARLIWLNAEKSNATIYYPDGSIAAEGVYSNKKKDGLWKFFDGEGRLSTEQNYTNGKKDGAYIIYYDDGSISVSTTYRNGLEHGLRQEFWLDGKPRFKGEIVDGNPDGEVKYFNQEGKLEEKGTYKNAVKHGKWFHYGQYGVDKITIFEYGNKIEEKSIENQE